MLLTDTIKSLLSTSSMTVPPGGFDGFEQSAPSNVHVTFDDSKEEHDCKVTQFDPEELSKIFMGSDKRATDIVRAGVLIYKYEQLSAECPCEHCAARYQLLADAIASHRAMLTENNTRLATQHAGERTQALKALGYDRV